MQIPSTIPGSGGEVALGAKMTGQAQIVSTFGTPFTLEGLLMRRIQKQWMPSQVCYPPQTMWARMSRMMWSSGAAHGGMIADDNKKAVPAHCVFSIHSLPPFFLLETDGVGK